MTRARRRLLLTCARSRRRYGGSLPEAMNPSRFLQEIPHDLLAGPGRERLFSSSAETWRDEAAFDQDIDWNEPGLDLYTERQTVRQIAEGRLLEASARTPGARAAGAKSPAAQTPPARSSKTYSGETYDSVDNLGKFFSKRGLAFDPGDVGVRPAAGNAARDPEAPPQSRTAQRPQATPRSQTQQRPQQQTLAGLGAPTAPTAQRRTGQTPTAQTPTTQTQTTRPHGPNRTYPPPAPNTAYTPRAKPVGAPRFASRPTAPRGPFRPGAKVRHAKFGVGTVLRLEGEGEDQKLSINFAGYGLKKVVLKYANLQRA
jgi:DNA helicase-2/ATP-dependent DNA helicase PcrA